MRLGISQLKTSIKGQNDCTKLHLIPDTKNVLNFSSLFHDPSRIPDKDPLLLADYTKREAVYETQGCTCQGSEESEECVLHL